MIKQKLGINSQKRALLRISGFEDLRDHKVTQGYETILSGYRTILGVYPGK